MDTPIRPNVVFKNTPSKTVCTQETRMSLMQCTQGTVPSNCTQANVPGKRTQETRMSPTTETKMRFPLGRRQNPKDDFGTSFQPIWLKQVSTDSSWSNEQSVTVNLTEVSRRNLVVFHLEVEQQLYRVETTRVFTPKLTACGTNTQTTMPQYLRH
jgi:hypothetical protein